MRRKKHKNTRRTVKFFKIHHGFREPYKVLFGAVKLAVKQRALGSQAASPSTSHSLRAGAHGWELCACHVDHQVRLCALLSYGHGPSGSTSAYQVLSSRSMKEVTQLIGSLLGGQVRLFTTRCCQQELKALGADFSGTTQNMFQES